MNVKDRIIPLKDGRNIRGVDAGQPEGIPILVHNGTPGSRLLYQPWIEDAELCGIRLMGYDRPGYGGSTPQPERTVASAARDVAEIAEALRIDRLLVRGISGGGPHALACAALLPELVVAAAALASPAPNQADRLDCRDGRRQYCLIQCRPRKPGSNRTVCRNGNPRYVELHTSDHRPGICFSPEPC